MDSPLPCRERGPVGWLSKIRKREAPPPLELPIARNAVPRRADRPKPERITTLNFEQFVAEHPRTVLDVWAPWCGPCRAFGPIFAAAAEQWGHEVGFGKIHADHEPTLVQRFKVRSIPTLLFLRQGKIVRFEVGVVSAERFEHQLRLSFRDLPRPR